MIIPRRKVLSACAASAAVVIRTAGAAESTDGAGPGHPVQGLDAQLKAETAPDVDSTNYWLVFIIIFGLVLFILLIVFFTVCCKDFDPESEFERRRRVQAQAKLEDAPKKMKKAAK
jgi:hypothetical protein